jgi:hypothetical protein
VYCRCSADGSTTAPWPLEGRPDRDRRERLCVECVGWVVGARTPAADKFRAFRPTPGSRSLPSAIAKAWTSSSVTTAGRPKRASAEGRSRRPLVARSGSVRSGHGPLSVRNRSRRKGTNPRCAFRRDRLNDPTSACRVLGRGSRERRRTRERWPATYRLASAQVRSCLRCGARWPGRTVVTPPRTDGVASPDRPWLPAFAIDDVGFGEDLARDLLVVARRVLGTRSRARSTRRLRSPRDAPALPAQRGEHVGERVGRRTPRAHPEARERRVIGHRIGGDHPTRDVVLAARLASPRVALPDRVRVEQRRQDHRRIRHRGGAFKRRHPGVLYLSVHRMIRTVRRSCSPPSLIFTSPRAVRYLPVPPLIEK